MTRKDVGKRLQPPQIRHLRILTNPQCFTVAPHRPESAAWVELGASHRLELEGFRLNKDDQPPSEQL